MRILTIDGDDMSENFVVGLKQTSKAILSNKCKQCYIANDADDRIKLQVIELCEQNNVPITYIESMQELGRRFKVNVGSATAGELR